MLHQVSSPKRTHTQPTQSARLQKGRTWFIEITVKQMIRERSATGRYGFKTRSMGLRLATERERNGAATLLTIARRKINNLSYNTQVNSCCD